MQHSCITASLQSLAPGEPSAHEPDLRAGRFVRSSAPSALAATQAIARVAMKRSGSARQRRLAWPTQGSPVSALSVPVIRSASVRPARLDATNRGPE